MINYVEIREMLEVELEEITKSGKLSPGGLDMLNKVTEIIKNTYKIEMLAEYNEEQDDEYSMRRGMSRADGMSERGRSHGGGSSYNESGDSYARRGQHYVRGHYSRDDGMSGRGYSSDEGKDHLMRKLGMMMEDANEEQREIIRQCMQKLENA